MDFIIWYTWLIIMVILLLLVNRHIIWWVGYNFFPPIIVGYAISMLNWSYERTLLVVLATVLWWLITKFITNYVNLSLYPRYGVYIILSLWVFVTSGIIYTNYNYSNWLSIEASYKLMFLFILIAAMVIKTYSWWKWPFSLLRWWHILRFFTLSMIISQILQWDYVYSYFMSHKVVVILLGLCTIMIWSYTGLQIKEMIRFRKLIWAKIINKKKRI